MCTRDGSTQNMGNSRHLQYFMLVTFQSLNMELLTKLRLTLQEKNACCNEKLLLQ